MRLVHGNARVRTLSSTRSPNRECPQTPGVDADTVTTRTNTIGVRDAVLVTITAPTRAVPTSARGCSAHDTSLRRSITNVLFGLFRPDEPRSEEHTSELQSRRE